MTVIDDIKDRLDLVAIVGRDLALKKEGHRHKACCPFHNESTPSFIVGRDAFHCFGCGAHGDVLDYVQKARNLPFDEALRELAREAGMTLRESAEAKKAREQHLGRVAVLRAVADFYHGLLLTAEEPRAYVRRRGFRDDFIADYRIGWAPGDCVRRSGVAEADLRAVGLLNETGRDHFWNRVIFPVWGRYADEIVDLAGRVLGDAKPKYLALPGEARLINERGLRA